MSLLLILSAGLAEWRNERCNLFRAHEWDASSYGKRRCIHCGEEQWLMKSAFERIGQPSLRWRRMNFDRAPHDRH